LKVQHNGQTVELSDEEIKVAMRNLDLSKEEAIEMLLDDLETTDKKCGNAEAEALTQKAKTSGVQRQMCSTGVIAKSKKKRPPRPLDVDKADLIKGIADYLETAGYDNVHIINVSKLIGFDLGEDSYEVDLKRKNKKLAAKKAAKSK
jgi:hypothetical protein